MSETDTKPRFTGPTIRFIFNVCNDLAATKNFYVDLLGMKVTQYEESWGYLNILCDGFEFMFFKSEKGGIPVETQWASQPGYEGGTLEVTSWALFIPEADFPGVVAKLRASGAKLYKDKPEWRHGSYWGFTVMDPNGVTVEVYTMPEFNPTNIEWTE